MAVTLSVHPKENGVRDLKKKKKKEVRNENFGSSDEVVNKSESIKNLTLHINRLKTMS